MLKVKAFKNGQWLTTDLKQADMHEQIVTEPNYVANRPVYYNVDSEINSPTKVFVAKITDGSPSPY